MKFSPFFTSSQTVDALPTTAYDISVNKYKCSTCQFVYDPRFGDTENDVLPGTQFDDLSSDWMCPSCGSGTDFFESMVEVEEEVAAGDGKESDV